MASLQTSFYQTSMHFHRSHLRHICLALKFPTFGNLFFSGKCCYLFSSACPLVRVFSYMYIFQLTLHYKHALV
ncbi:hypothetical protein VIGAN_04253100 [Vigna angularis var. angularis]|uniref:Uncharacterized protein n=1 Tax=Vigna angularis var. angularis TaxID=157739 RepID=A0A0S3RWQ7_PHAAN|nr:hypothetical protein VIGAN_04253100 [Vigna angularis var. angularis]